MGVDIHIKPSVSEVRVDVDESNNSDEDNSISSDDVYIKENRCTSLSMFPGTRI